jgi:TruD family tRNA pseudouridine synthase
MLSLFYLLGNNFTITTKYITLPQPEAEALIEQTIQELTEAGGIPNYFGHQRFGTTRPITHLVGKSLSQGNFEEATMLFLANPSHTSTSNQETQDNNSKRHATLKPQQIVSQGNSALNA